MVGLPSHGFLAGGFDFVGDPTGEIPRSVIDLAILWDASREGVRKKVRSLDGWIEVGACEPLVGFASGGLRAVA